MYRTQRTSGTSGNAETPGRPSGGELTLPRRGCHRTWAGAIAFVQWFSGLVNLNVYFHLIVPGGVFVDEEDRLAAVHPGAH
jgi:hypothetical protein